MPDSIPYERIPRSDHAAPVCRVQISYKGKTTNELAIIDSGADVTCISKRIADELSLEQSFAFEVEGVNNETLETRPGYFVDFDFLGFEYKPLVVVAVKEPTNYVLIGRDVLCLRELTLSGLSQSFTIE